MNIFTNWSFWAVLSIPFFLVWFFLERFRPKLYSLHLAPDNGVSRDSLQIGWMYRTFNLQKGWGRWHFTSMEISSEIKPAVGLQFFPVFDEIRNNQHPLTAT